MVLQSGVKLDKFFIFNPTRGTREGSEHEKIIYHWSSDPNCQLEDQIQDVSLCEASITLVAQFNQVKKHLSLAFTHSKVVISEVEPNYWFGASVSTQPDDNLTTISDGLIEAFIGNQYKRLCLFYGSLLDEGSHDENDCKKKKLCAEHFDSILSSVKLSSCISNVVELFGQIQYLNLDSLSLMKVNSFTNHLCCLDVNNIAHSLVIFNDHLIWSSLTLEDTRVLYHYMISVVIREALNTELSGDVEKVRKLLQDNEIHLLAQLNSDPICCERVQQPSGSSNDKKNSIRRLCPYYMTTFRSSNDLTICIILRRPDAKLIDKCEQYLLGNPSLGLIPMISLGQVVGQNFIKLNARTSSGVALNAHRPNSSTSNSSVSSAAEHSHHTLSNIKYFAYFDRDIASHRSPLVMRTVDNELLAKNMHFSKYIMDLEWDLDMIESSGAGKDIHEIIARTVSDTWLSAYKSCSRVVYSLQSNRNASLVEAAQSQTMLIRQFQDMMF